MLVVLEWRTCECGWFVYVDPPLKLVSANSG